MVYRARSPSPMRLSFSQHSSLRRKPHCEGAFCKRREAQFFMAVLDRLLAPESSFQKRFFFLAKRFVAGETATEAMAAIRSLNAAGMTATLDFLGEDVTSRDEALHTRDAYMELLDRIEREGLSVRTVEQLVQLVKATPPAAPVALASHTTHQLALLQQALGTALQVRQRGQKGTIEITFSNGAERDKLLTLLAERLTR